MYNMKSHIKHIHQIPSKNGSKKVHTCEECGRSYSYKYDLKQHYKTHGTPLYVCEYCGFQSSRTQTFKNHMNNRHLKLRPFKCPHPLCNKRFFNNGMLTGHLAVHTSERKFKCKQCKKTFKTNDNLRQHMISHRPADRRHSCPYCLGTFSYACNMKTHIKNIHQVAQDDTVKRERKKIRKLNKTIKSRSTPSVWLSANVHRLQTDRQLP